MPHATEPVLPSPADGIYLARQSILDRSQDLHAFELLFRAGEHKAARFTDGTHASATVMQHVLNDFGLDSVLGKYKGFINLDETMLMSDLVELLPRDRVVLEVLETVELSDRVVARLTELKRAGFSLAIDDVVGLPPALERALEAIDIVKIDVLNLCASGLRAMVDKLRRRPLRLLAEKVADRAQMTACLSLGFELFQGFYFARPQIIAGKRLSHAEATIMRLLGMLVGEADNADIEKLLKQEPGLTMNLLRLTNSVGAGAHRRIGSVSSALVMLGRRQMLRWLQLLLYATSERGASLPTPLMHLAATRGHMMELLAARWDNRVMTENAFLTGIMSLMDALLSMPMADILGPLPVAEEVRDAVLDRGGRLGALLRIVEASETRDGQRTIAPLLSTLPKLVPGDVEQAQRQALRWANSLGH